MRFGFTFRLLFLFVCLVVGGALAEAVTPPATTRAQAIATVRSILKRNTGSCQIKSVQSVSAVNSRGNWRVTAKLVMSASGKPLSETATWTVKSSNGEAVPANQLTAEISIGCP